MFWEYIKAVVYGIIEGVTEWLPISSTGHLILLERIISLDIKADEELTGQFLSMFDVVIQLGAILAVVCIYARELIPLGKDKKASWRLWGKLMLATLPAAVIGLAADAICERLMGRDLDTLLFTPQVVASALIVYGILFILVEKLTAAQKRKGELTHKGAFAIGCFQALALIPGTSRSGATILGARILGIDRETAARFSFLAAVPVIAAASLLKLMDFVSYAAESEITLPASAYIILSLSFVTAFAVSMLTVRFLTDFVKKHTFIPFGIYRIILGAAVLFFIK